ncbi:tRNA nucleotidyltransferase (CCA-adding enzyme) [Virgibacillus subterraneus]|uniref:CCA-adding enzyme n=1 Tax=Virgibacillus subterraneus TaxID=621109 RepID=A0A1H9EL31_9BACI|nr:tRNA nucleotidyltransferase (CCA-adding enzyme) [Virgibacillus subterraneus]
MVITVLFTKPFIEAIEVLNQIESHAYDAYFVGGCVRDLLLKREIGDIDIATSAPPSVIQQIFNKVIPVGLEHGTVIVRHRHQSYEVTTFRVEGSYSDQRHPDTVEFIQTIDQDLKRRDFTINALAMDKQGNVIDLFDGRSDIENKIIQTVGNGYDRFMEDPLRIIRALRFSSQLGFSISPNTINDMKLVKSEIENIAVERINNEMTKLFAGDYIEIGLNYLTDTEVYQHLPIMNDHPHIIELLPKNMQAIRSFGGVIALFHFLAPTISIKKWVNEWKCSNNVKNEALILNDALLHYKNCGLDRLLVYCLPRNYYQVFSELVNMLFNQIILIDEMELIDNRLPIKSKKDLAITGDDVRELFPQLKSGPWIRNTLAAVEHEVLSGKLKNNKMDLKDWIKWNPHVID